MRVNWIAGISFIVLLMGCAPQNRLRPTAREVCIANALYGQSGSEETLPTNTYDPGDRDSMLAGVPSPCPDLAMAVDRGDARVAGPITEEAYRGWTATAELQIKLEGQLGKRKHLRDLLKLAEHNENRFIDHFTLPGFLPGESADRQLRMFQVIRERLNREIQFTEEYIANLGHQLTSRETREP